MQDDGKLFIRHFPGIKQMERRGADLKLEPYPAGEKSFILGSAVPKWFRHGAKNLACRAGFLARVKEHWSVTFDTVLSAILLIFASLVIFVIYVVLENRLSRRRLSLVPLLPQDSTIAIHCYMVFLAAFYTSYS